MKRYFEESDLENLSREDYRLLLTEQFETHRRLREQAQSIIRMIIAGTGIIIALLGYKLYPEFVLPSRTLTIAGGAVEFHGMLQSMAENSLYVAALFAVLGLGLLFSAIVKSIKVLTSDSPVPLSRRKTVDRESTSEITDDTGDTLRGWILTNDNRIVEAEREVEQSYTHIWACFVAGFIALFLTAAALLGSLKMIGLIHTALVIIGPSVAIYYLKDTLTTFLRTTLAKGLKSGISAAGDVYEDTYIHQGVDPNMKVAFIIFYGAYLQYSVNIAVVWIAIFLI